MAIPAPGARRPPVARASIDSMMEAGKAVASLVADALRALPSIDNTGQRP